MAEAAVDLSSAMSTLKYFCHQCSQETDSVLSDFTCPRCRSGFIEEVNHEESDGIQIDDSDSQQMADILEDLYEPYTSRGSRSRSTLERVADNTARASSASEPGTANPRRQRHSGSDPHRRQTRYFQVNFPRGSEGAPFEATQSLEGLFQHILTNVASAQLTPGQGGGINLGARGLINIDFPLFQVLHGNPGDYAWGEGGLNEIISQLLNQLDGAGPPPMPKEDIDKVPFVAITEEQVQKNLQCTVCMEDFKANEKVRALDCSHCYHNDCIVPWLQMHATCPVCRKELATTRISSHDSVTANHSEASHESRGTADSSDSNTNNANYESTDDYD